MEDLDKCGIYERTEIGTEFEYDGIILRTVAFGRDDFLKCPDCKSVKTLYALHKRVINQDRELEYPYVWYYKKDLCISCGMKWVFEWYLHKVIGVKDNGKKEKE